MEKFGMLGPFDVYIKNLNRSKLILIQFITMTIKVVRTKLNIWLQNCPNPTAPPPTPNQS